MSGRFADRIQRGYGISAPSSDFRLLAKSSLPIALYSPAPMDFSPCDYAFSYLRVASVSLMLLPDVKITFVRLLIKATILN